MKRWSRWIGVFGSFGVQFPINISNFHFMFTNRAAAAVLKIAQLSNGNQNSVTIFQTSFLLKWFLAQF